MLVPINHTCCSVPIPLVRVPLHMACSDEPILLFTIVPPFVDRNSAKLTTSTVDAILGPPGSPRSD